MALQFKPEFHEYISNDGDDIKWMSATSFLSKFKKPFDGDAISNKVAKNKKSKWYGMVPEEIKEIWRLEAKRATDLGTWYHDQREKDLCSLSSLGREGKDIPIFVPNIDSDGSKTAPDQQLCEGIYPEHMMYLKSVGLCGQADYVEVVNNKVNIIDYKTSKEIKKESFKSWEGVSQKMAPPVAHLDDCNFNHYCLQLSLYMYIILKHNHLYFPGTMTIQHVIFKEAGRDAYDNPISEVDVDGNPIVVEVINYNIPYLKQEIISLINHLKNNYGNIN